MSYYEKRIAELEARVEQLAREQRLKAIPVEAKLLERYALMQADNTRLKADAQVILKHLDEASEDCARLKAEVERLRKAGDGMEEVIWLNGCVSGMEIKERAVKAWNAAKEGQP